MDYDFFAEIKMLPAEASGVLLNIEAWTIEYIITGVGTKYINDVSSTFSNGDVILTPPLMFQSWEFKDNITDKNGKISAISITIKKEFLQNCAKAFPELQESVDKWFSYKNAVKLSFQLCNEVIPILQDMCEMSRAERAAAIIDLIVLLGNKLEGRIIGTPTEHEEITPIEKAKAFIEANSRGNVRLKEVVNHMGMNRTDFCHFFKLETGETFVTYLKKYRLKLACEELEKTKAPIAEICYNVGFENIPYFNHLFKRTFGMSPTEYRKKAQKIS